MEDDGATGGRAVEWAFVLWVVTILLLYLVQFSDLGARFLRVIAAG